MHDPPAASRDQPAFIFSWSDVRVGVVKLPGRQQRVRAIPPNQTRRVILPATVAGRRCNHRDALRPGELGAYIVPGLAINTRHVLDFTAEAELEAIDPWILDLGKRSDSDTPREGLVVILNVRIAELGEGVLAEDRIPQVQLSFGHPEGNTIPVQHDTPCLSREDDPVALRKEAEVVAAAV